MSFLQLSKEMPVRLGGDSAIDMNDSVNWSQSVCVSTAMDFTSKDIYSQNDDWNPEIPKGNPAKFTAKTQGGLLI